MEEIVAYFKTQVHCFACPMFVISRCHSKARVGGCRVGYVLQVNEQVGSGKRYWPDKIMPLYYPKTYLEAVKIMNILITTAAMWPQKTMWNTIDQRMSANSSRTNVGPALCPLSTNDRLFPHNGETVALRND